MSTDYHLYAPDHDVHVMVGSENMAGISTYTDGFALHDFVKWAIRENITDIVFLSEYKLSVMRDELGYDDDAGPLDPPKGAQ